MSPNQLDSAVAAWVTLAAHHPTSRAFDEGVATSRAPRPHPQRRARRMPRLALLHLEARARPHELRAAGEHV
jgi:hypothetical protein